MLETKDYLEAMKPLTEARESRLRRVRDVAVISHDEFGGPDKTGIGNDGTILFFLARNRRTLDAALESMRRGPQETQAMIKGIERTMAKLKPRPLPEVLARLSKQNFGALTYGGCTLIDPLFLPEGMDLTIVNIPYAGGRLIPGGFKLVDFPIGDDDDDWCGTAVPRRPKLTPAEKEAFAKIPKDLSTIFVGHGYDCEYTSVMAVAFGVAGGVAGAAGGAAGAVVGAAAGAAVGAAVDAALVHALGGRVAKLDVTLSDVQIRQMGPGLSAKTLVNMRRSALQNLANRY